MTAAAAWRWRALQQGEGGLRPPHARTCVSPSWRCWGTLWLGRRATQHKGCSPPTLSSHGPPPIPITDNALLSAHAAPVAQVGALCGGLALTARGRRASVSLICTCGYMAERTCGLPGRRVHGQQAQHASALACTRPGCHRPVAFSTGMRVPRPSQTCGMRSTPPHSCPFWHEGEATRRRPPAQVTYGARLCSYVARGQACPVGDGCSQVSSALPRGRGGAVCVARAQATLPNAGWLTAAPPPVGPAAWPAGLDWGGA